ncbi:ABC transporter ATP-binding protein [Acinetobacter sp. P8-3-8]|uniref:ATP-binding cassette domain-containing protein n=1 Tax=Acinetobacter sp. P8-3-8 TaxID=1029823 RepID=UPI00024853BF|nr:ABC transporter ATP-binding protein [Acinetobacter sp. P8-3-8]
MSHDNNTVSIRLERVSKKFLQKPIFEDLNFTWQGFGIYSLIGENGAGKSTILSMIAGLLDCDSGKIFINGQQCLLNNNEYKKLMAFVPDHCPIYSFMQGQEFLDLICSIRKLDPSVYQSYIEKFRLEDFLKTTFAEMSFGTAKKFLLISALMTEAPVLLLDEPNNGLDQATLQSFRQILIQQSKTKLILMSCHDQNFRESVNAIDTILDGLKAG